ncbi:hypothetical protein CVT24_006628 [Panaeolus cyanescens]|uniref:C2H2-type domain-containing protein n=1 Tax=Panaeolus cyanescens TaxID=181874 RepID=A0A409YS79_9AGAR|nr:hypothetical protein CVT24_006628 [Panaeolus cyanescens]
MAPQRTRDNSDSGSGSQSYPQFGSRRAQAINKDACTVCGKVLSRKYDLQRHIKSHQPKDKACPYPGCDFKARSEDNLDIHIRRHTDYKPFVCQDDPGKCTYASYDAAGLHRHRKNLHGYVPNKGSGPKAKARPRHLPVTVLDHLAENDNESAQEDSNVFSAGKRAGKRRESDEEELDQLHPSSDESASAVFGAPLNTYPFSDNQQLAVPPFWAVNPADQSLESLQGWNVDSDVKLEESGHLPLELQGQGSQDVYSYVNPGENDLSVAAPAFDVDQVAANPFNTNSFPTEEDGISFDALETQNAFESMLMGYRWIQVPMGWVFANPALMPLEYPSQNALLQAGESWTVSDGIDAQQLNLQ